jgi:hypothetical protein
MHKSLKEFFPAKTFLFLLVAVVLAANFMALNSVRKQPFNLDEVEEFRMGKKFSSMGPSTFLDVPGGGEQISHPLLYTFSHALVQRFFGSGLFPLRMYGVFHYFLSLVMVLLISFELGQKGGWGRALGCICSGLLFLSNPLLVQHSVIVNADNNILTTAVLVFFYFFVKSERSEHSNMYRYVVSRAGLGVLFAVCLWAKLMAPLFMISGILTCRVIGKDKRGFWGDLLGIAFFGAGLFWITWYVYCAVTGTDVMAFIEFTILGKGKMAFSAGYLEAAGKTILAALRWPVYWVSAPFWVLALWSAGNSFKSFFQDKKLQPAAIMVFSAFFMWLPFLVFKPNIDMMKYQYPAYPLIIVVIGHMVSVTLGGSGKRKVFCSWVFYVAVTFVWGLLFYHYFRIGDYILALWRPMTSFMNGRFLQYYYLPILLFAGLVALASERKTRRGNVFFSIVLLTLAINSGLLINQAKADYITAEVYRNY